MAPEYVDRADLAAGLPVLIDCAMDNEPRSHRRYVAGWLRAFRKASGWLPRGRHRSRRLARKVFCSTLKQRHSLKTTRRSQQPQVAAARR